MPEVKALSIFITAAIIMLVTPGPAVLYIVARSIEQGRLAGLVSALGIALGGLGHVLFAALGLSVILVQSAAAFMIVKYLGAFYLVWLGIARLLKKEIPITSPEIKRKKLLKIFSQGFVVNLLNPKTAIFFMAFLPQFVNPAAGSVTLQVIYLGMIFIIMAVISDSLYALLAGTAKHLFTHDKTIRAVNKYIPAGIYLALGIGTLFIKNGQK